MGQITGTLHDTAAEIGARWAQALRRRYPGPHAAKRIAGDFDVEIRTAEAWLAGGNAPYAKYLLRAWRLHGVAIVAEVLAPGSEIAQAAPVDQALQDLEGKLHRLRDELAQLRVERA